MTEPTDASADTIVEQLCKLINDSPALNLKLLLRIYLLQNKKRIISRSQSALASGIEKTQKQYDDELVLLEFFLSIQANQQQRHFQLSHLLL